MNERDGHPRPAVSALSLGLAIIVTLVTIVGIAVYVDYYQRENRLPNDFQGSTGSDTNMAGTRSGSSGSAVQADESDALWVLDDAAVGTFVGRVVLRVGGSPATSYSIGALNDAASIFTGTFFSVDRNGDVRTTASLAPLVGILHAVRNEAGLKRWKLWVMITKATSSLKPHTEPSRRNIPSWSTWSRGSPNPVFRDRDRPSRIRFPSASRHPAERSSERSRFLSMGSVRRKSVPTSAFGRTVVTTKGRERHCHDL